MRKRQLPDLDQFAQAGRKLVLATRLDFFTMPVALGHKVVAAEARRRRLRAHDAFRAMLPLRVANPNARLDAGLLEEAVLLAVVALAAATEAKRLGRARQQVQAYLRRAIELADLLDDNFPF